MKKLSLLLLLVISCCVGRANDGAFYSNGNHLIPINDSVISVQKEILTITRVDDTVNGWGSSFLVDVYYEFYNPGEAKDILVGFEAPTPDGHVSSDVETMYAGNPYINGFQVIMNGKNIPWQLAHVPYRYEGNYQFSYAMLQDDYYKNGQVVDMPLEQYEAIMDTIYEGDDRYAYLDWSGYEFYYVYHFNAHFEPGVNIIQHTYVSKGSSLVMMDYVFDYILTAANRWANNGIDDFTLVVDMGGMTTFACGIDGVEAGEWTYSGHGKTGEHGRHVQSGKLMLHKKNFHPEGELGIIKVGNDIYYDDKNSIMDELNVRYLSLDADLAKYLDKLGVTKEERRILKNTPFAYRGFVFKTPGLQKYFDSTEWYVANPDYKADMNAMTEDERAWIEYWSK
ncbi:MAG: YARHG domain-containing protein [Bacteroidales bacterium]|nr:YARHG domain-containing protein [Bacteroidales bacterium]